jgi:hypothetical protein
MTTSDSMRLKFMGGLASQGRIPAYEAAQSLYGITRSIVIIANYAEEGRVRRKEFGNSSFQLNLVATKEGSFETILEFISNPLVMAGLGAVGLKVTSDLISDFIKSILKRSVGQSAEPSIENLEDRGKLNSGDLQALVEAIEPAMREAHRIINNGASKIILIHGNNNNVTFDNSTKEYVNTNLNDREIRTKLFSIASLNANSGNGRAFDFEESRTIPFQLGDGVDRRTITSILKSISNYSYRRLGDNIKSAVALKYRTIQSVDGRVKKIIVLKARDDMDAL